MAATHISAQVDICAKGFLDLASALSNTPRFASQTNPQTVTDEFDRFKIWAGNLAAHRKGRRSLEYRLRDAIHLKDETQNLLISLQTSLYDALSIVHGKKVPWDEFSDSDSDSESDLDPSASTDDPSQGLQGDTELKQISASVKNIVTCLFRLSMAIREPAPDSQLKRSITIDKSYYESHDVQHVQAKFGRDDFLTERLGRAISGRRQYLAYREEHHRKLSKNVEKLGFEEPKTEYTTNSTEATPMPEARETSSTDNASGALVLDDGDNLSQTSYATSINATLRIPRLPKNALEQEHFECPFCYMIVSIQTTAAWKQHVYRDLHPYSCTFEQCATADRLYDSRRAWWKHELEAHRTSWQCVEGCEKNFATEVSFTAHVQHVHPDLAGDTVLPALKRTAAKSASLTDCASCPLCGLKTSLRILQKHLGAHQEQLALFVLPPNLDATEDDVDDEKSSLEEAQDMNEEATLSLSDGADSDDEDPDDTEHNSAEMMQTKTSEELLPGSTDMKYLKDQHERDEEEDRLKKEWELKQEKEERKRIERAKEAEEERKRIILENTMKLEKAEREAKAERQAAVDAYNKERDEKEAKAKAERERVILEYERKKVEDNAKAELQRKELILQLKLEEEEQKREEEEEWERFKQEQRKKEDEEKAKKKKQEEELEDQMRKRLAHFGFQETQIQAMIKGEELQRQQGMTPLNPLRLAQQPTYVKVHKEHLAIDTLLYYDIPYEVDRSDPNYIIILREMDAKETEVLFEHSRRLRSRSSRLLIEELHDQSKPNSVTAPPRRVSISPFVSHDDTGVNANIQTAELSWPDPVQEYIRRAFDSVNSVPGISQRDIASKLNETLRYYRDSEMLDQVDWSEYPLPQSILLKAEKMQEGSLAAKPSEVVQTEQPKTDSQYFQPSHIVTPSNPPKPPADVVEREQRIDAHLKVGNDFSGNIIAAEDDDNYFDADSEVQTRQAWHNLRARRELKEEKRLEDLRQKAEAELYIDQLSEDHDTAPKTSDTTHHIRVHSLPSASSSLPPYQNDGYSYTDPAGMYRDTEPVWRGRPASPHRLAGSIREHRKPPDPGGEHDDSFPSADTDSLHPNTELASHTITSKPRHRAPPTLANTQEIVDQQNTSSQEPMMRAGDIREHNHPSYSLDTRSIDDNLYKANPSIDRDTIGRGPQAGEIPKGILRKSTEKFPEDHEFIRPGVAPYQAATKLPGVTARWTKIDRHLVNPQALEEARERFEERMDCVIVLRVLTTEEIQKLADRTLEIRQQREATERQGRANARSVKTPETELPRGRGPVVLPATNRPTSANPTGSPRFSEELSYPRAVVRGHSSPPVSPQFQPVNLEAEDSIENISLNNNMHEPTQTCARCLKVGEPCSGDPGDGSGCDECKLLRIPTTCTFATNRSFSRATAEPKLRGPTAPGDESGGSIVGFDPHVGLSGHVDREQSIQELSKVAKDRIQRYDTAKRQRRTGGEKEALSDLEWTQKRIDELSVRAVRKYAEQWRVAQERYPEPKP